ncbi:hypothetical protein DFJ73DRAFT_958662 [Zopfochytrium polystomum]|nr:hypothetical protein DFJ73DRAFT_958662 [Zopfochytrium polystomum]
MDHMSTTADSSSPSSSAPASSVNSSAFVPTFFSSATTTATSSSSATASLSSALASATTVEGSSSGANSIIIPIGVGVGGGGLVVLIIVAVCWVRSRRREDNARSLKAMAPAESSVSDPYARGAVGTTAVGSTLQRRGSSNTRSIGGAAMDSDRTGSVVFQPVGLSRRPSMNQLESRIELVSAYRDSDLAERALQVADMDGTLRSRRRMSTSSVMTTGSLAIGFSEAERRFGPSGPDVTHFSFQLETLGWVFSRQPGGLTPVYSVAILRNDVSHSFPASNATLSLDPSSGSTILISSDSSSARSRVDADHREPFEQAYRALLWKDVALQIHSIGGPSTSRRLAPSGDSSMGRDSWLAFLNMLDTTVRSLAAFEDESNRAARELRQPPEFPDRLHELVQEFCGIVVTLVKTATSLPVRIGYEPRACNEVALNRHEVVSLWHVFDDFFGYGLNVSTGIIGFINLGHLDARRLAVATAPPPLPPAMPKFPLARANSRMHQISVGSHTTVPTSGYPLSLSPSGPGPGPGLNPGILRAASSLRSPVFADGPKSTQFDGAPALPTPSVLSPIMVPSRNSTPQPAQLVSPVAHVNYSQNQSNVSPHAKLLHQHQSHPLDQHLMQSQFDQLAAVGNAGLSVPPQSYQRQYGTRLNTYGAEASTSSLAASSMAGNDPRSGGPASSSLLLNLVDQSAIASNPARFLDYQVDNDISSSSGASGG